MRIGNSRDLSAHIYAAIINTDEYTAISLSYAHRHTHTHTQIYHVYDAIRYDTIPLPCHAMPHHATHMTIAHTHRTENTL